MARPSPVRDAVRRIVAADERHDWSIDELVEVLAGEGLAADFSTVFRAVTHLEGKGAVRRIVMGDGKARYEAAGHHHDHIRCVDCGSVSEVPGCVVERARATVERQTGYRVTGHELMFAGVCSACEAVR